MVFHSKDKEILSNFEENLKFQTETFLRPSNVDSFLKCPASILLRDKEKDTTNISEIGKEEHQKAYVKIKSHIKDIPIPNIEVQDHTNKYIEKVINKVKDKNTTAYGLEAPVHITIGNHLICGKPDFFSYNEEKQTLTVVDFKALYGDFSESKQILLYSAMILNTIKIEPESIACVYFARNMDVKLYERKEILKFVQELYQVLENNKIYKFIPTLENCSSCFQLYNCNHGKMLIDEKAKKKDKNFYEVKTIRKAYQKIENQKLSSIISAWKKGNHDYIKTQQASVSLLKTKKEWKDKKQAKLKYALDSRLSSPDSIMKTKKVDKEDYEEVPTLKVIESKDPVIVSSEEFIKKHLGRQKNEQ